MTEATASKHTENRVFGSPGTGKTTYLIKTIRSLYEQGLQNDMLLVSFTRTAAQELIDKTEKMLKLEAEKRGEIYDEFGDAERPNIGTLHAIAWHSLGKPTIAETRIASWNDSHPYLKMGSQSAVNVDDLDEATVNSDSQGSKLLAELNLLRSRMVPTALYPDNVRVFKERWEDWKRSEHCIDFTDMIYRAYRDVAYAPNKPQIFIADEAQDFNKLQFSLFRKWSERGRYSILAGDDDQCLYSFTGASPESFLNPPVPDEQLKILPESHRLPRRILAFSDKWVKKISKRQPKVITSTNMEGEVLVAPPSFKLSNKDAVIKTVEQYLAKDKTIMILASCSYMLNDIRVALKDRGIPFHNPYRLKRGDWNPIRASATVDRLMAFLAYSRKANGENYRPWNTHDIALWASAMRVKDGLVKHGASKILKSWADREYPLEINAYEALEQVFEEDLVHQLIMGEPDLDWYYNQLLPDKAKSSHYPLDIIKKRGLDALREKPKVILGTIHSVKGGEANVTILFPDLSLNGMKEWVGSQEQKDAIRRVFYVGATRSTETLILGSPNSNYAIRWNQ
jgi:DNA helicase-2/ATP-dependent DNA helicase PcrA